MEGGRGGLGTDRSDGFTKYIFKAHTVIRIIKFEKKDVF